MRDIRVAIVSSGAPPEDDLVANLAAREGLRVVSHATDVAGSGARLVELRRSKRDVLVIQMPQLDVNDPVLHAMVGTDTRVVLVAERIGEDQVYAAARIGVRGFAFRDAGGHAVVQAIVETHRTGGWLPPTLGGGLVRFLARLSSSDPQLTTSELHILEQLCDGARNSDIARTMCCTVDNVKWHLKNVYRKLQVRNRAEAAAHAVRTGIVDIDRT
ncbi:MAG: response regulator transcription factor [Actinomycetota bacterium]|nr:response regulator transcription factor [Actinomycetota bacterium]